MNLTRTVRIENTLPRSPASSLRRLRRNPTLLSQHFNGLKPSAVHLAVWIAFAKPVASASLPHYLSHT